MNAEIRGMGNPPVIYVENIPEFKYLGIGHKRNSLPVASSPKCGLTSAPRRPQAWQVNRGSRSDRRTSSGHRSPVIAV
jgi:hypothetical protein